jgi:hypothetical protein
MQLVHPHVVLQLPLSPFWKQRPVCHELSWPLLLFASAFPDTYLGLYSSTSRHIEVFAFKSLKGFTRQRRNQGTKDLLSFGGKKARKQVPCLFGPGARRKSVSLPRQLPPAAQQRDSGSQAQGSRSGKMNAWSKHARHAGKRIAWVIAGPADIARQIRLEASTEIIFAAGISRRRANLHPSCQD